MRPQGSEAALARLEARREKIQRELARVERVMAQASYGIMTLQTRIAILERSERRAA